MPKHSEEEDDEPKPKKKRIAQPGVRHRREREQVEITAVPHPTNQQLGTLHVHTEDIIGSGSQALIAAHKRGAKLATLYGEEFKEQWRLKTKWLEQMEGTHRGRVRSHYAMRWRPTFLACVALTHSVMLGGRASGVAPGTVIEHRTEDPDFERQVLAAQDHCIELLHAVAMRRAIEGDCEPIIWQGIQVGAIRKFDGRLQIEMLRAHMPKTFKTPGSKAPITIGDGAQILVCDDETTAALVGMRQTALQDMKLKRANATVVTP
jgi:hypothetical protein